MKKEIKIRQYDRYDCASACVASVCAYYGLRLPLLRIREACGTTQDGTTLQGIIDACGKLGLDAVGLQAKEKRLLDLRDAAKPVIMHLKKKNGWLHYVVLYGMDADRAEVMDPEDGRMHRIPLQELEEEWSGFIVAASPSPMFRKGDHSTPVAARFRELFLHYKKELLLVLTGSAAFIAATLSTSVFLQKVIDDILPSGQRGELVLIGCILICLVFLTWFVSYMRSVLLVRVSLQIDCRLITGYFRKLFSLPLSFFDNMGSGDLNSRVSDAYRIRSFITGRLLLIAISIITLVTATAVLMSFYWKLTLITLSLTPFFVLLYRISDKVNRRLNRRIIETNAKFEQTSIDSLSSARAVRYFNSGRSTARRIESQYHKTASALYRGGIFSSVMSSTSDSISRMINIVTLVAGAFFVLDSQLTVGELVSFYAFTSVFTAPIVTLIESNDEITEARISAERIFDIMDMEQEDSGNYLDFTPSADDRIEARGLCFSFPGRMNLLEDLSFDIVPGGINLIRGDNGSGKSTVAALLMKGYVPQSGRITAGGVDIQSIHPEVWRKFISIVPQKPDVFDGTILENIILDDTEYDLRSVASACAMAGLKSTLDSIPGGILAHTGEQACRLSGGERQKIALARALYRKPKVLILDEAATHLDSGSRKMLRSTLTALRDDGVTIILISHEQEAASLADNIIDISEKNNKNAHSQA